MRVLLDANVLLRTVKSTHPDYLRSRSAVQMLIARGHEVCVVPQVLYETWSVATRPLDRNGLELSIRRARTLIEDACQTFTLLPDPPDLFGRWQQLVVHHEVRGKQSHDARLVAAMQAHAVEQLLTFNKADFVRYPGLTLTSP